MQNKRFNSKRIARKALPGNTGLNNATQTPMNSSKLSPNEQVLQKKIFTLENELHQGKSYVAQLERMLLQLEDDLHGQLTVKRSVYLPLFMTASFLILHLVVFTSLMGLSLLASMFAMSLGTYFVFHRRVIQYKQRINNAKASLEQLSLRVGALPGEISAAEHELQCMRVINRTNAKTP